MPDRKYTYQVEIDVSSAAAAAQQIRALFQRELGDIFAGPAGRGGPAEMLQQAQAAAGQAKTAIEQLGKIDLAAPVEDLNLRLQEARRSAAQAREEYERFTHTAGSVVNNQSSRRERALMQTYYEEVDRFAGSEAASNARMLGRALNVGQRNAEFKNDQASAYEEAAWLNRGGFDDTGEKKKYTTDEKAQLAKLEAELYQADLAAIQAEKAITQQRLAQLEAEASAIMESGTGITAENQHIFEEADQVDAAARQLAQDEADLLNSVEQANKRAAEAAQKAASQAARQQAKQTGAIMAGEGLAGPTTTQTALTVSGKSAENAERLALAMQEAATATAEMNRQLMSADRRLFDVETARQSARAEGDVKKQTEQDLIAMRRAEEERRQEAARTAAMERQEAAKLAAEKRRLAKEAADVEKAEAKKAADAEKAAKREAALAAKQAAKEAAVAQKEAAAEARAAEKAAADAYKKEMKEKAAAARAAAKEAAAAEKVSLRGQFGDFVSRPFGMSWGSIAGGLAATAGIYGADQLIRGTYSSGKEGALQIRQEESFNQFAESQGRNADEIIKAIRRASKETITETDAMGLASQVLAQKFTQSRESITTDLETLVRFSRRASQIYRDESGQFLSTQEVFARLIKYSREGNKELVDQFGLSNAAIAEAMGTTVQGLASASGAADRWKGLIMLLGQELGRLGDAGISTADKIEQSEARITASKQRLDKALAGPTEFVVRKAADFAEGATTFVGASDLETTRRSLEGSQTNKQALEQYLAVAAQYDAATAKNAQSAAGYEEALNALGQQLYTQRELSADGQRQLEDLNIRLKLVADGNDAYARAMAVTTMQGAEENETIFGIVRAMGEYENMLAAGALSMPEYLALLESLTGQLAQVAMAAGYAAGGIAAVNGAAKAGAKGLGVEFGAVLAAGRQRTIRDTAGLGGWYGVMDYNPRFGYDTRGTTGGTFTRGGRTAYDPLTGEPITSGPGSRRGADDPIDQLRQGVEDMNQKNAEKAAREWESAAGKAAKAYEKSAEDAASAYKSALEKIPGLFGTSDVTEQDMNDAKLGIYKEKPDEYLRQLRDEVLNKKDTPADLADIARVAGIDQSLDPKAQLALIERMWQDSSLFANPEALRFINKDAVDAAQADSKRSEAGKANILSMFGLGQESPLTGDQKDAFAKMIGLEPADAQAAGQEARTAFDTGFYAQQEAPGAASTGDAAGGSGMASSLVTQIQSDVQAGPIADAIYGLGSGIIAKMHAGFSDAAANADWGDPVFSALAADVAPIVFQMLKDQLPPA